jgi:serine/threonine protein kinase
VFGDGFVIHHKQDDFSPEFKDLVLKMIAYNMLDRPSISQIKQHPWLKGPTPSSTQVKAAMSRLKSKFIEREVEG